MDVKGLVMFTFPLISFLWWARWVGQTPDVPLPVPSPEDCQSSRFVQILGGGCLSAADKSVSRQGHRHRWPLEGSTTIHPQLCDRRKSAQSSISMRSAAFCLKVFFSLFSKLYSQNKLLLSNDLEMNPFSQITYIHTNWLASLEGVDGTFLQDYATLYTARTVQH